MDTIYEVYEIVNGVETGECFQYFNLSQALNCVMAMNCECDQKTTKWEMRSFDVGI